VSEQEHHHSHKKLYMWVFFGLFVLTILEVWIPSWPYSYAIKSSLIVFLACVKAWMVAYFFMHLNEEKAWLKFIALIPLSAGVYALVNILEAIYR
jgi:cytochrome c oxidase subunit IV